jgi:hypothetical protein
MTPTRQSSNTPATIACCQAVKAAAVAPMICSSTAPSGFAFCTPWRLGEFGPQARSIGVQLCCPLGQGLVLEEVSEAIPLALLLGFALTAIRATLPGVAIPTLGKPDALGGGDGVSRRLHGILCCGRECEPVALPRDPRQLGATIGLVGLASDALGLSAVRPAGDGTQAVGEGDYEGRRGNDANDDRADAMPHEPKAHRSCVEQARAERDEAKHDVRADPLLIQGKEQGARFPSNDRLTWVVRCHASVGEYA